MDIIVKKTIIASLYGERVLIATHATINLVKKS